MAFDFSFIAHAAHTETVEFPPQCVCHGMTDGGLANTWRADQKQNGAAHLALEGPFSQKLDDAVFDIVQAVVIPVENLAGFRQVEVVFGMDAPGHLRQPVQIISGDAVFR